MLGAEVFHYDRVEQRPLNELDKDTHWDSHLPLNPELSVTSPACASTHIAGIAWICA